MEKGCASIIGEFDQGSMGPELEGRKAGRLFAALISRNRALLAAFGVFFGACATASKGSSVDATAKTVLVFKGENADRGGRWGFMTEAQKEAARYLSTLPCDRIEEMLRQSKAIEIPLILSVVQASRGVQGALESNDVQAIREKSARFYALAMAMGEGESQRKFRELQGDPGTAMELMMFQDYFIPALEHAQRLSAIGD